MTKLVGFYLIALAVVLVAKMLRDHVRGRVELLSVRNLGLLGFILFQLTSAAVALLLSEHGKFRLQFPTETSLMYAAMVTVFIVVALFIYNRGWVSVKVAKLMPSTFAVPSDGALLFIAVLTTALAAALRLGVMIPVVAILAGQVGMGLSAVSAGLVGWVWGRRLFNPVIAAIAIVIISSDLIIVMFGTFGRRGLVAVGAAMLWGMYYSSWRLLPLPTQMGRMALLAIPPIVFTALFSSVRESNVHDRTAGEHLSEIARGGNLAEGLALLAGGQGTGPVSMFLLETHPEPYEYKHLDSLRHFIMYPVPRLFWPNKPLPLSRSIPTLAQMTGVDRGGLSIGPGVVGTAGAEGGWYALLIYAVLFGAFLRAFDEATVRNIESPFVVVSIGCAMGQIIGLARGQCSSFAFLALMAVGGSLIIMVLIGKLVERLGGASALESAVEDEYDEYDDREQSEDYSPTH